MSATHKMLVTVKEKNFATMYVCRVPMRKSCSDENRDQNRELKEPRIPRPKSKSRSLCNPNMSVVRQCEKKLMSNSCSATATPNPAGKILGNSKNLRKKSGPQIRDVRICVLCVLFYA